MMDAPDRLDGWKEIASYIGRSTRTAIRWHKELDLPVRRISGSHRPIVSALRSEIDEWERERREHQAVAARANYKTIGLAAGALALVLGAFAYVQWFQDDEPGYAPAPEIQDASAVARAPMRGRPPEYFEVVGHWKFDESSGATAVDSSGNGHDGQIFGATRVPGLSGGALAFDGDDSVVIPHDPELDVRGAITIEAVIKCIGPQTGSWITIIVKNLPGVTGNGYELQLRGHGDDCVLQTYLGATNLSLDEWHHVVWQQDGNIARAYVDGRVEIEAPLGAARPATPSPAPVHIGGSSQATRTGFAGVIDEIRVSRGIVTPLDFLPSCPKSGVRVFDNHGESTTFTDLQRAVASASDGSRIEVAPGVFPYVVEVSGKTNVAIIARCGTDVSGWRVESSNNVTISGFRVDASDTGEAAITLLGEEVSNVGITISGNEIANSQGHGVFVGPSNWEIDLTGNYVHHNAGDGIHLAGEGDDNYYIKHNLIQHNCLNGLNIGRERSLLVYNNTISHNGTSSPGYGIFAEPVDDAARGFVTVVDNIITNNQGTVAAGQSSRDLANYPEILDSLDHSNTTTCSCEAVQALDVAGGD